MDGALLSNLPHCDMASSKEYMAVHDIFESSRPSSACLNVNLTNLLCLFFYLSSVFPSVVSTINTANFGATRVCGKRLSSS